ncbi:MAG: tRNA (guanosine(46)-N7)-methyltransferase TrmB [Rhizobiales bacterium]|nr:tRNA (guanosine(46)-N7)-methyltransferase TrmB [Hyphomicrobiales bacterium]
MAEDLTKKSYIFGRQKCKKLSARQQNLVETLLPKLKINPETPFEADSLSQCDKELWLEIGFGGGEHLSATAKVNPDIQFIGCEPFLNGIAKLLVAIEGENLENIRIFDHDARKIINWLPAQSLSRIYLLYPDPWPKKRHRKRRFVTAETLKMLARVLKPGADFIIASDIGDYIRTSLSAIEQSKDFVWSPQSRKDWRTPPEGWPSTRYEQKALREGRYPTYLKVKRTG